MSNRRKPTSSRRLSRADETARRDLTTDELPWVWAMQDADEAERRGDAEAALAAVRRRAFDPDGRPFWRACRVQSLEQLVALGPAVHGSEDWWEGSALLHAAVVSPEVLGALAGAVGPDGLQVLAGVADLVTEPATDVLTDLVAGAREVA